MKTRYAILVLISCMLFSGLITGAVLDDAGLETSPLFQSNQPLTLHLKAPFRTINRHRGGNRPYSPATMTLADPGGKETQLDLEIRVRGNFRSDRVTCKYPPLKLNFKQKSLTNTVFDGENKLKLVVQCKDQDRYKQFLMLEYLCYKVYQLLTDYSLQVRLVQVEYYDNERNRNLGSRPAFFIEDTGRFAERLNLTELEVKNMPPGDYVPASLNLAEMFEYFIGNTDWASIAGEKNDYCCHNIIPFRDRDGSKIPVPYDFDMTGIVDPSYAVVKPGLRIHSVRQRLYRGHCQNDDILQSTINAFKARRDEIYSLYKNQSGLSDKSIEQAISYYDVFYDIIQDEEKLEWAIMHKCR